MAVMTATSGLRGAKTSHLARDSGWVRPVDWLPLPPVVAGDQKFVGLVAVYPGDSNWVAVQITAAHTIDWGDGTAPQNVASNGTTSHNYAYSAVSGTDCTRGYRQAVVTITPQAANNLVAVFLTPTRPTGMVSGWSSPWLDIKVAGANVNQVSVSSTTTRAAMVERFEFVGPSAITSLVPAFSNARALQEVVGTAWTSGVTSFASMFNTCTSLRTIPLLNTGAGTNFNAMFSGCTALEGVPLLDTAAGTLFSNMFFNCTSLRTIPLLSTALGTDFNSMFNGCTALQTIPLLNTAACTAFNDMFSGCNSLQSVPALNTAAGTNFSAMFNQCMSLQSAPLAGTSRTISYASAKLKGSALDAIYTGLTTLDNKLSIDAASVETTVNDWNVNLVNCAAARVVMSPTNMDGTSVLRLTSTASGEMTAAITTRVAVSASTQYSAMAVFSNNGPRLGRVKIGWYDAGGSLISTSTGTDATAASSALAGVQLPILTATSPAGAVTASLILSATATTGGGGDIFYFDKMGLFLGTKTMWTPPAQTITVTSNWDVANDTPSIATAKGWTVTG